MQLNESKQQLLIEHNRFVEEKSMFPIDLIGKVLADIISRKEGKNYHYQNAQYYTNITRKPIFDQMIEPMVQNVSLITEESVMASFYSNDGNNSFSLLVKQGKILPLPKTKGNCIFFYQAYAHLLKFDVELYQFSYIKDFIDQVIDYKIEHQIDSISYHELEQLAHSFLEEKPKQKQNRYSVISHSDE